MVRRVRPRVKSHTAAADLDHFHCSLSSNQQDAINDLVRKVGDWVRTERDKVDGVLTEGVEWKTDETGHRSPVTTFDKEAGDQLVKGIQAITPDIPIISEEMSPDEQKTTLDAAREKAVADGKAGPTYWSVDPIDGTNSFIKGAPTYAVLVGLVEDGKPTFGSVYFPKLNTRFFTRNGHANEVRGDVQRELQIALPPEPDYVTNGDGIGKSLRMMPETRQAFEQKFPGGAAFSARAVEARDLSIPYDDALMLRGDADLRHVGKSYNEWDIAAYHAILHAAGARYVNAADGKPVTYGADDSLRVPPHWVGKPLVLQMLGLSQQGQGQGTATGRQ